ncbi:MAG: hypothetical protein ACPL3P_05775 [Anaerolineales bacterium]
MEPKVFRASNTQAALEMVQNELGPEAMILSVKQIPGGAIWETWKKPEVEVLALPAENPQSQLTLEATANPMGKTTKGGKLISSTYNPPKSHSQKHANADLQIFLDQIKAQIAQKQSRPNPPASMPPIKGTVSETLKTEIPPALIKARNELIAQGIDPQLIKEILKRVSKTTNPKIFEDESRLREIIRKQLETFLRILQIEHANNNLLPTTKVIFIIGQSGVGKTSLCARLASHFMEQQHKNIAWVCADTIRTGAIAQTRAYTEALNIRPHIAYTPADLKAAIEKENQADLILVDTPARNPLNQADLLELSAYLTEIPQKVTLLTLPATLKFADMQQAVAAFSPLLIHGIALTKIDETLQFGNIFNLVWKTKIPLAYFCDGTHLLDSLQPAQANRLTKLILP